MQLSHFPSRLNKIQNSFPFLFLFGRYIWIYEYIGIHEIEFYLFLLHPPFHLVPPCIHIYCINFISQPWILLCHQRKNLFHQQRNPPTLLRDFSPLRKSISLVMPPFGVFPTKVFPGAWFSAAEHTVSHQYWYLLGHFIASAGRAWYVSI